MPKAGSSEDVEEDVDAAVDVPQHVRQRRHQLHVLQVHVRTHLVIVDAHDGQDGDGTCSRWWKRQACLTVGHADVLFTDIIVLKGHARTCLVAVDGHDGQEIDWTYST